MSSAEGTVSRGGKAALGAHLLGHTAGWTLPASLCRRWPTDIPESPPPTPPPKPSTPPPGDEQEDAEGKADEVNNEEHAIVDEGERSDSPRPSLQVESGEDPRKSVTKKHSSVVLSVGPDEKRNTRTRISIAGKQKEESTEDGQDTSHQSDTAAPGDERRKSSRRISSRSASVANSERSQGEERRRSTNRDSEVFEQGHGRRESKKRSSSVKRPDSAVSSSSETSGNSPGRSRSSTRSRQRFSGDADSLEEDGSRRQSRKSSRRSRTSTASVQIRTPDDLTDDSASRSSEDASEEQVDEEQVPPEDVVVGPITVVKSSEKRDCVSLEELREEVSKWVATRVPRLVRRVKPGFDIVYNGKVQEVRNEETRGATTVVIP